MEHTPLLISRTWRAPVVLAALLFVFTGLVMNAAAQPPGGNGSPVVVEKTIIKTVRPVVQLVGTAEPNRVSVISPGVDGLVVDYPARRGKKVNKGDLLAELDKKPLLLNLKRARASLAEARENWSNASSELKRVKELFQNKTVSDREYERALYSANAYRKKIHALEAELEAIQYDIRRCTITAPFSGSVIEEHTQVGQWVERGGKVATIAELDPILISTPVPDRYVLTLEVGQEVDLEFDFLAEPRKKGIIRDIMPEGNEKARTFPVDILVRNPDLEILSGMSCRVNLRSGRPRESLLVNKDAVVTTPSGRHVFTVRGGKAVLVPVKQGGAYGGRVAVEGKLSAGETVVVEGNERLRPGQPVRIVEK